MKSLTTLLHPAGRLAQTLNKLTIAFLMSLLVVCAVVVFSPVRAIAQVAADAGEHVVYSNVTTASTVVTTTGPVDVNDPTALANIALNAVLNKNWGLLCAAALILLIGAMKRFVPEATIVGSWLHSQLGGWVTNFSLSAAGVLLTAQLAGQAISVKLALTAVTVGLSAAGMLELWRDIVGTKANVAAAQAAGAAGAKDPSKTLNQ